jgi:hypothetical protein
MKLRLLPLALITAVAFAVPAGAQSLGTFRWQLQPFGSILNLNVTQQGSIYLLNGFEFQCGGNPSLPAWGVAVPQANGGVFIGVTTITNGGHGLHTRAFINLSDFSGGWADNANQSGTFAFNPGVTCPGSPRVDPIVPDQAAASATAAAGAAAIDALKADMDALRQKLAELEAKKQ